MLRNLPLKARSENIKKQNLIFHQKRISCVLLKLRPLNAYYVLNKHKNFWNFHSQVDKQLNTLSTLNSLGSKLSLILGGIHDPLS